MKECRLKTIKKIAGYAVDYLWIDYILFTIAIKLLFHTWAW